LPLFLALSGEKEHHMTGKVSEDMKRRICLATLMIVLTAAQAFAQGAAPAAKPLPFTLTISGGISLGSYEAGVNWALIDYMRKIRDDRTYTGRKPDLTAVTGASAGAINALLSALIWSVDGDQDAVLQREGLQGSSAVNSNIIRNAWVNVGIDELIPLNEGFYCNPTGTCRNGITDASPGAQLVDELFTRHAFEKSVALMKKLLDLNVFVKNRTIDIALLATRETPVSIETCSITVKNQRYVFLLSFVTDSNGRGHFESEPLKDMDPDIGTIAYLPKRKTASGEYRVDPDDVIRLMYASSAFPVAFGKVNLTYCTGEQEDVRPSEGRCPGTTNLTSADFIDGGLFDNVPLGAALALRKARLAEQMRKAPDDRQVVKEAAENLFFFISPSNRRHVVQSFKDPVAKEPRTFGLSGIFGFLPGFIDAAQDHELYTVLRSGIWKSYDDTAKDDKFRLVVTDRYFPITGSYLGHFGAFLDRPFREFDYAAGVYDSINDLAALRKVTEAPGEPTGRLAKDIYTRLGLDAHNEAADVFSLIASQEQDTGQEAPWFWVKGLLPDPAVPNTMYTIFRSIIETSRVPLEEGEGDQFNAFIARLHENGYMGYGPEMQWIMKKYDEDFTVWYAPLVGRAGNRLQELQTLESAAKPVKGAKFLVGAASLGLDRYFDTKDRPLVFLPSSVQTEGRLSRYSAIPYELGFDTANGGVSISYLVRMQPRIAGNWSLDLKVTPVGYNKFGDTRVGFSQADLYLTVNKVKSIWSFGAGPTLNYLWQDTREYSRSNLGTAVFAELFQTVRLTVGVKDNNADVLFGHNFYVTVGIVDLPGIVNRVVKNW
jgi:hypothetical protein